MASETLADIVAEMRELAADIEAGNAVVGQTVWRNYAYRIEEAAKRSKYERLHECFWDKRAVQCVVRQMLDERDDLSGIDPVSANRMEYFANQLIGAASDGKSFGNAAAMREALVQIVALARQDQPRFAIISTAETALAAPSRQCDRFEHYADAEDYYHKHIECAEVNGCFDTWLFEREEKQ